MLLTVFSPKLTYFAYVKLIEPSLGLVGDSVCDTLLALHMEIQSTVVGKVLDF